MAFTDAEKKRLLAASQPTPTTGGFSDAERARMQAAMAQDEPTSFAERAIGDILPTLEEDVGGLVSAVSDIPGTAKGLARLGVGTADLALGGLFGDMYKETDPEAAQAAREFGSQYVQEIKDFEQRPVRAAANIAPVGGLLGALGKVSKVGKVAKVGKAIEALDPLTALGRTGKAVVAAPFKTVKKVAESAAEGIGEEGAGIAALGGETFDSALGFTTGTSTDAMGQLRQLTEEGFGGVIRQFRKDKKSGRLNVLDKYNSDYQAIRKKANVDYEVAKQALVDEGIWSAPLRQDPLDTMARLRHLINDELQDAGARVRVRADGTAVIEHSYERSAVANKSRKAINNALEDVLNPKFAPENLADKVNV